MLTLALQTADAHLWGSVQKWFKSPEVQVLPWGRLYAEADRPIAVDDILHRAIALVERHSDAKMVIDSTLSLGGTPSDPPEQQPLSSSSGRTLAWDKQNALAIAEQALNTPMARTLGLVITQQVFWQLAHAGRYDLRLVAQLAPPASDQPPSTAQRISLFEVFNGEPAERRAKKQETKTQFEQALFLYLLGFCAEAECLFANCLQLNPQDAVAAHYVACCQAALTTQDE
ncbi:MAG: hypothetical protein ACPGVO_04965 [Spirulinaceae cyanobacterium]